MVNIQNVPNKDLSKGEKQKVMLAAAFIHDPSLLFLDEPFIGLDPFHQKQVRDHLIKYIENGGTIFMCTHILELAEKMCTRIAIIDHGKIVASGTLDEVTKKGETIDNAFLRYTKRSM
jgi:ABC-2 type transport system ATP-binding protein